MVTIGHFSITIYVTYVGNYKFTLSELKANTTKLHASPQSKANLFLLLLFHLMPHIKQ